MCCSSSSRSLPPCQGFRQYNPHHTRDVWTHTLAVVDGVPPEEPLRLAALLHDAGKPATFFFDKNLVGHFYGHPAAGAAVTEEVLRRLRYDRATTEFVTQLVAVHGRPIPDDLRGMRRMLARLGAPVCRALIQLRCADAIGTGTADAAEQTARREAAWPCSGRRRRAAAAFPLLRSPAATCWPSV